MTTETTETVVVIDETPAQKQSRFHNPFAKKNETDPTVVTEETPKRKHRAPRGAVTAGLLLVAAGVGAAIGSKLGSSNDETSDVPMDSETNN